MCTFVASRHWDTIEIDSLWGRSFWDYDKFDNYYMYISTINLDRKFDEFILVMGYRFLMCLYHAQNIQYAT